MNINLNTFLILNILCLIILLFNFNSNSIIKLLISLVIITLFQGLSLICLGVSILGIYLIIIYIGAIVILFAFCILFINNESIEKKNYKKYFSIHIISIITAIISVTYSKNFYNNSLTKNNIKFLSENSYLKIIAIEIYNNLLIPLLIMILLLLLGLIIVIRILLDKK